MRVKWKDDSGCLMVGRCSWYGLWLLSQGPGFQARTGLFLLVPLIFPSSLDPTTYKYQNFNLYTYKTGFNKSALFILTSCAVLRFTGAVAVLIASLLA